MTCDHQPEKGQLYVAVDIGCIECSEKSHVLGVFTDIDAAKAVCEEHELRQKKEWRGEHHFRVFPIPDLDVAMDIYY